MTNITRTIVAFLATFVMVLQMGCAGLYAAPGSIAITVSPTSAILERGQSAIFRVSVPRAHIPIGVQFSAGPGFSCTPNEVRSTTPPYIQDVTVTARPDATPGPHQFNVVLAGETMVRASANITVTEEVSAPSFTVSSSGSELLVNTYVTLTFTIKSQGTFAGTVALNWETVEGVGIYLDGTPPAEVTLTPGSTETIKVSTYTGVTEAPSVTFRATSGAMVKTVTIPIIQPE